MYRGLLDHTPQYTNQNYQLRMKARSIGPGCKKTHSAIPDLGNEKTNRAPRQHTGPLERAGKQWCYLPKPIQELLEEPLQWAQRERRCGQARPRTSLKTTSRHCIPNGVADERVSEAISISASLSLFPERRCCRHTTHVPYLRRGIRLAWHGTYLWHFGLP